MQPAESRAITADDLGDYIVHDIVADDHHDDSAADDHDHDHYNNDDDTGSA